MDNTSTTLGPLPDKSFPIHQPFIFRRRMAVNTNTVVKYPTKNDLLHGVTITNKTIVGTNGEVR